MQHAKLVIDTNAVVRGVHFERMARELYTVPEVLAEIRDRGTRGGVLATAVLPDVRVQEPSPEHIRRVMDAARRTGDAGAISPADAKVIALTLALHEEAKDEAETETAAEEGATAATATATATATAPQAEDARVEDGEGEWITPENVARKMAEMRGGGADAVRADSVRVGCLTADFAMQNVLLFMGIPVVSFEGLRITAVRTWALKCFSCYEIIRNTTKVFCPKCGNSTLRRVQVETSPEGELVEVETPASRRLPGLRGTIHPIAPPKGGRPGRADPVFSEDELQHRLRTMPRPKADDISAGLAANPFGVGSSGSRQKLSVFEQRRLAGVVGRNPNASRHRIGKKNKSKPIGY